MLTIQKRLPEGSRCELNQDYLNRLDDEADVTDEEKVVSDGEFCERVWPHCLAFLRDASKPLAPLAQAQSSNYRPAHQKRVCVRELFNIKVNAIELGWPALRKAADAALTELESIQARGM